jgi:hypothetical protein
LRTVLAEFLPSHTITSNAFGGASRYIIASVSPVQHDGRTINEHIRAVDIIRAAQPPRKNMLEHGMAFLFRSRGVL